MSPLISKAQMVRAIVFPSATNMTLIGRLWEHICNGPQCSRLAVLHGLLGTGISSHSSRNCRRWRTPPLSVFPNALIQSTKQGVEEVRYDAAAAHLQFGRNRHSRN